MACMHLGPHTKKYEFPGNPLIEWDGSCSVFPFPPIFFLLPKCGRARYVTFSKIEWEKGGGLNNTTKGKRKEFSLATSVRQQQQKQKILVVSSSSVKVLLSSLFHTCLLPASLPPGHNIPSIFLCRSDISSLCLHNFRSDRFPPASCCCCIGDC